MLSCAPDGQVKFATKSMFGNKLMEKINLTVCLWGLDFFFFCLFYLRNGMRLASSSFLACVSVFYFYSAEKWLSGI